MKKVLTSTPSYSFARILLTVLILGVTFPEVFGQCSGCTQTVSTNTAVTVNNGQVVCLSYSGTYSAAITFSGGTVCVSPGTTVSSAITVPSTGALNIYGRTTGSYTQNGGTTTIYSGGIFSSSTAAFNGGTFINNTGGSATFNNNVSISTGVTFTNNGAMTFGNQFTNNGGTVTLSGTQTLNNQMVNNSGTMNVVGPATLGNTLVTNGGTVNLTGPLTITNNITNNATINLTGALTLNGNYSSSGSLNASAAGCNSMTVGGNITSNSGAVYNGNNYGLAISPTPGCCMSNLAYGTPASSPSGLSMVISGTSLTGSFTSPSAAIAGYIVLRYVGSSASSASPVSGTNYSVGSAIGTNTVAAIIPSAATGTRSFTDTVPTGSCGKNIYYRIFSYNGSNTCGMIYKTSGPLTGNTSIANNTASISASGATTFCAGGSVILTASGGTSYMWSNSTNASAITATTSGTYTVTATNAFGCTASASSTVSVNANPTLTASSNSPVCVGSTISLTATASGSAPYTYSWSGPGSFTSTSATSSVANANTINGGSYIITVTDNNSCTVSASTTVIMSTNCIDSTTVGANGGGSSDAPCTQVLRFDHYNDVVASSAGGQQTTWVLKNGSKLSMNISRIAGSLTAVTAPTWSGAAFGQSGYTGLSGKTVLYTTAGGWSKVVFSNIQLKDSNGVAIPNFTLIGIDAESTDGAERDTLVSNGTTWFDYDTITPPGVQSVPSESGIGTSTLVWTGTGNPNARARLVSTNSPTTFSFSTVAGGLQGFAMAISNPIQAPTAITICSNSSFNATPTNLPTGTTYTWTAPVVSPAGSLTGATAQNSPLAIVGQTLVNTTSSPATATYSVIPSNNCSGLGYTVTVTVNPAPSASITSNGAQCIGGTATVTATAVTGGPLTYSWSGPLSFTSASNTFTLTNTTLTQSGTYTLTITGSNTCTASTSTSVSIINCLTVSGAIFDDANGNGIQDGTEAKTSYGQTLYSVIADTTGTVISTGAVAANGTFTMSNVLPSTSGMTVRISTSNPAVGSSVAAASWPSNWLGTLGQYGTNNLAGSGVYNNTNELIPVRTGTTNITNIMIGFDRLAAPVSQAYSIAHPALNTVKALTAAAGLGNITWSDPEDAANTGSFVVISVANMHSNVLFYDSNSNNIAEVTEIINGYKVINNFTATKMKVKFAGLGSATASFAFAYIDAAGKTNPTPSTYTVSWSGALPVKLISFTAALNTENNVDINWTTATEIDNDHFEVERSDDAASFTAIDNVKGAGNSSETINYHTVDYSPLPGTSYYRLKQVDFDGKYTYSNVVSVTTEASILDHSSIRVFPTLVTTPSLHIATEGIAANTAISVTIVDLSGRIVSHQNVAAEMGGNNDISLELPANMTFGTYIVACESNTKNFTTKIVYSAK